MCHPSGPTPNPTSEVLSSIQPRAGFLTSIGPTIARSYLPKPFTTLTYLFNSAVSNEQNINERVHWSVLAKRESGATPLYNPPNLPRQIPPEKTAAMTDEEQDLLQREQRLDVPSAQSGE